MVGLLTEAMLERTGHQRIAHLVHDTLVFSLDVENHMVLTCLPQLLVPSVMPAIRPTHSASRA